MYAYVNAMSASAFLRAGHAVIDLESVQGVRVDGHQLGDGHVMSMCGPEDGMLHFCEPGVPDWAIDAVLDLLSASNVWAEVALRTVMVP